MKSTLNSLWRLVAASSALLAACSTPQVALDQANHSAKLVSLLEMQLAEFRRVQSASEQARLDSLRRQRAALIAIDSAAQLDISASKSAGDTIREALASKMLSDADGVSAVHARAASAKETYDERLSALLSPLPATTAAMTEVQAKMAAMGTEIPREKRYAEFLTFAKDIRDNIEANKKKIKDAEAAVKTAVETESPK
jgi:hypothetical protein